MGQVPPWPGGMHPHALTAYILTEIEDRLENSDAIEHHEVRDVIEMMRNLNNVTRRWWAEEMRAQV